MYLKDKLQTLKIRKLAKMLQNIFICFKHFWAISNHRCTHICDEMELSKMKTMSPSYNFLINLWRKQPNLIVWSKKVEILYVVTIAMKEKNASTCYMAIGAK
jgi:hypothetical protein